MLRDVQWIGSNFIERITQIRVQTVVTPALVWKWGTCSLVCWRAQCRGPCTGHSRPLRVIGDNQINGRRARITPNPIKLLGRRAYANKSFFRWSVDWALEPGSVRGVLIFLHFWMPNTIYGGYTPGNKSCFPGCQFH